MNKQQLYNNVDFIQKILFSIKVCKSVNKKNILEPILCQSTPNVDSKKKNPKNLALV